jgi:RNA polymerase sigma-70 factor (ECF subfamily)
MSNPSSEVHEISQASDAELIRELQKGRGECFDQLVLRYQRMVYAIARRMTSNHQDADDIAQETFLAAYRAMGRLDVQQSFPAYLSRIAVNLSINHLRRKKRWLRIWSQRRGEAQEASMGVKTVSPQKKMEQSELLNRLEGAMKNLPPHQRAVLVLKVDQEMSYQEIAKTLKISMGTVMSRLHRARNRLRSQLEDLI